ncbi:MAG TPA: UPF0280 family protein [Methanocorpusculum sp.]|nr:UPF0280 family protein [Methanocorpusculum sp.]
MLRQHFAYKQTITTILADCAEDIDAAKSAMLCARADLEGYIASDPFFSMTYDAYAARESAPEIVRRMSEASLSANVGPMASVAASIAWAGVEAMKDSGALFGLIDNGGDIAVFSDRDVSIGIFAGNAPSSSKYAFVLPPQRDIAGVCTSSATVGPSVSFGIADAVVCFSANPAKADAWATGLCNVITPENFVTPSDADISGVYAVAGDWIGKWGVLPRIVSAEVDAGLITKG